MIIYNFIKTFWLNFKYTKILKKVYKDENLIDNLSSMFGVKIKMDWIGRLYCVLNPHLIKGEYDEQEHIFEYGNNGLDDSIYVERWIMKKLNVASKFIQANNLFDLLTYNIKKLDDSDNYLFVIQPITLEDCMIWLKRFLWLCLVLMIIAIGIFILL